VFAPDGRRVVTCSDDKTVRCWDLQTGRELARFHEHTNNILDLAVSPDGRFAASVAGGTTIGGRWAPGDDFGVRIWRLPQGIRSGSDSRLNLSPLEGGPPGEVVSYGSPKERIFSLDLSADG
jgi:WD40 repeat protein